jgi:hypothetical protein
MKASNLFEIDINYILQLIFLMLILSLRNFNISTAYKKNSILFKICFENKQIENSIKFAKIEIMKLKLLINHFKMNLLKSKIN